MMHTVTLTEGDKSGYQKNSGVLQGIIDAAKDGDTLDFSNLDGNYYLLQPITQRNKGLRWVNNFGNFVLWCYGKDAQGNCITFTRDQSTTRNELYRITVMCTNDVKGSTGLFIEIPTTLRECNVMNFGRCVFFTGNAERKTDSSYSKVYDCAFGGATGPEAVLCQGPDANHIAFEHVDFRDCVGVGLFDNSFLGCEGSGNGFHNCAGGSIKQGQPAATVYYDRCYMEQDNGASTIIHGQINGFIASPIKVTGEGDWQRGSRHSRITVGALEFVEDPDHIRFGGKEFSTSEPQLVNVQVPIKAADGTLKYPTYAHWQLQHLGQPIFNFFGAWQNFPADYAGMKVPFCSLAVPHIFVGRHLIIEANLTTMLKDDRFKDYKFNPGDTLLNPNYSVDGVFGWVYTVTKTWKIINI